MSAPREDRPHLLVISHRVPYPPDKGDRIRTYHLIRQLAEVGHVSLATLADEPTTDVQIQALKGLCHQVAVVPVGGLIRKVRMGLSALTGRSISEGAFRVPALSQQIQDWHRQRPFDSAIVSASSVAPYLRTLKNVPAFVDVMDCDSRKWLDFAEATRGPKRWLYQFESKRVRQLEREIASDAAAVTVVSRAEAEIFDREIGSTAEVAMAVPNGVDLEYYRPRQTPERLACTFVGAMDYLPNVDAVTWFAEHVWPRLRENFSAAEFRIVGRKPTDAVQALGRRPGIVVTGTVPDVRDDVAASAVVVAPMRLSRGLQNKVLESLAMGKATVVAPPALVALKAIPGRDLLRAESVDDWVRVISDLFENPARRAELGRNGRTFVESNHDWATCLRPLTDLIRTATERTMVGQYQEACT